MTQRPNIFRRTKYFYTYDKICYLAELLGADLSVSVPVEECEGLLEALHLLGADMLVRAGPIRDEYWSPSGPIGVHLARSAMTAAHHSPRTRPPLLAPGLAIVTPHSNISVVSLSTISTIYYALQNQNKNTFSR